MITCLNVPLVLSQCLNIIGVALQHMSDLLLTSAASVGPHAALSLMF